MLTIDEVGMGMCAPYLKLPPPEWKERALPARRMLSPCAVRPHLRGGGLLATVAGYGPHFAEELAGGAGSGTVFGKSVIAAGATCWWARRDWR